MWWVWYYSRDLIRAHLTSLEEVKRARSTSLLSEVLGQLPEYQLTKGEGYNYW